MKRALVTLGLVAAGCAVGPAPTPIIVYVTATPTTQAAATPSAAPASAANSTASPSGATAEFGDGVYVVGSDISPGTYRTRTASEGCYWERLSGFGGSDIIANDNTDYPAVVTIARTDKGFRSNRCGTWTSDLSAITISRTSFGPGTYIVAVDLQPGLYRSSGGEGCYWARLSDFSGDGIIANDNTDVAAIVDIKASDKGFESHNCGTWTRR